MGGDTREGAIERQVWGSMSVPGSSVRIMTGQQVRWTAEQVLTLAPDAASRKAGDKLATPGPWSQVAQSQGALWGLCKGSGKKPYQTVIDLNGPGYKCSCPSRKFPCKHALALLLLWARSDLPPGTPEAEQADGGESVTVPDWAEKWLAGRRERAERVSAKASGSASVADPEAARKRAERRAQRIGTGASELEQRLVDLLGAGTAGAEQAGYSSWEEMAARMVDAQAPGLASRVRDLGSIPSSGEGWPARLLAACSLLHLLNQGYLRRAELPEPLAATVRAQVGLSTDTATLLADETARADGVWTVLGQQDSQEGRLSVRRVWFQRQRDGRLALLLSFGAAGESPAQAFPVGAAVEATFAFHPGASPLRVAVGENSLVAPRAPAPVGGGILEALERYGDALREDPWLESWPVVLVDVVPVPSWLDADEQQVSTDGTSDASGWQIADLRGDAAIPLRCSGDTALWRLAAVSGGHPVTVFGECGPRGFAPHTVWSDGEAVTL